MQLFLVNGDLKFIVKYQTWKTEHICKLLTAYSLRKRQSLALYKIDSIVRPSLAYDSILCHF
jgi:hypothetical protein